ncbi:response regulator transcription factor [Patescibacteria group bacterium]|nr:response regulator transcription factor [Patescibacteria group bacterium]MBU1868577.1 response regulator transcription factor [Patescibacteria group bacterium]
MAVSKKILIVEDDKMMRDLYSDILTGAGYEVELAEDGLVAEKMMKKGGYDLVLLDIMLPDRDGLQVLESLNVKQRKACGKVVVLTNLGQDTLVKNGFELGADGYLFKYALNPDQILEEMKGFLGEK